MAFQTAPDMAHLLRRDRQEPRKLSRAGTETLAIIAYHEPVSRAEIEAIRGVQVAKGTIDVLMEAGWVRPAGRREVPGRPLLYATTADFLTHFGLSSRRDLPGIDDLRAAGLLDPIDLAVDGLFEREQDDSALENDGDNASLPLCSYGDCIMGSFSLMHWVLVVLVIVLLFGGGRISRADG